ncbi:uncharacterized protein NPIL_366251 [Nephila pilipes]|uniref:Uncharacterized protein n=1 Tax=Nephila pilipes TaxID=299642 RepID=A0A8X6MYN6_NEPPI|nr:uncharacterized protein NPIL_366251 [Nephila pilipes]
MLSVPSLKDLSAAPIAVTLYNDSKMQQFLKRNKFRLSPNEKWRVLIKKKLPSDVYPLPLQEKIISLMESVNYEFKMWKQQHKTYLGKSFDQRITSKIHWKSDGTIDISKTASFLIQSDVLPMKHRFRLACNYWKNEDILKMWEQMPADLRDDLYKMQKYDIPQHVSNINVIEWLRWYSKRGTSNTDYNQDTVSQATRVQPSRSKRKSQKKLFHRVY